MRQLEWDIKCADLPKIQEENEMLRQKVSDLEDKCGIVGFYQQIVDDGIDTKDLVEKYGQLKKDFDKLENSACKKIAELEQTKCDLTYKLKRACDSLKAQQDKVVNPLIKEVAKREEEN